MGRQAVLITGAAGEVGLSLIEHFAREDAFRVIALDLKKIDHVPGAITDLLPVEGDITDSATVRSLFSAHDIRKVFHLAGVLSSGSEKNPERAHEVNVNGSFNLLKAAHEHSQRIGEPVQFIFPSSIAVYGLPSREAKTAAGAVREDQFLTPITMYGINKLYVENLGGYLANHYRMLEPASSEIRIDFRALRLPGLISSETVPLGGTTDYASQMVHACARKQPYASFASADVKIPFMAMPDAVTALIRLSNAGRSRLTRTSYNVTAFSVTVEDIRRQLLRDFPDAPIAYAPDDRREQILHSWPAELDDSAARADWGWRPAHSFESSFREYLIPGVTRKYR